jgi:hypothetical protein
VIYLQVTDAKAATYEIANYIQAIEQWTFGLITTEFSHALAPFEAEFANVHTNGKAPIPGVVKGLAG